MRLAPITEASVLCNPGFMLLIRNPHHFVQARCAVFALSSFIFLFLLIVTFRLSTISSLPLPLWVDSVHHSAIVRLILEQGALPTSYRPYADVDVVYYHLGYHVVIAVLANASLTKNL